jgi:hypothetical protein
MAKLSPAALVAKAALFTYLAPRIRSGIAMDAAIDYGALVQGVTRRNYRQRKPAIVKAVRAAMDGKMANDADISDLAALLDALTPGVEGANAELTGDPAAPAGGNGVVPAVQEGQDDEPSDIVAKIKAYLAEEGVPPEILSNLDSFLAEEGNPKPDVGDPHTGDPGDAPPPRKEGEDNMLPTGLDQELEDMIPAVDPVNKPAIVGSGSNPTIVTSDEDDEDDDEWPPKAQDGITPKQQEGQVITKAAMDAAIKYAQSSERNNQRNIRQAERFVRPWVGDMAMDASAPADVYRATLKALGMDSAKVDKLHVDALVPILEAQPKAQRRQVQAAQGRAGVAADAAPQASFAERFPMVGKITVQ